MAYDGTVTRAVVCELTQKLSGGKIDKIYQPHRDEIVMSVRGFGETYKLFLSANASSPRVNLTKAERENPPKPPMFCMLLRKHLEGGRIISVSQIEFDRVIKIDIESYTELGDLTVKSLMVEIMGKHSNIILVDSENKILDSIKHIDFTVSSVRQILPGLYYSAPPAQNKLSPVTAGAEGIFDRLSAINDGERLDKILVDAFMGVSPLAAREIVYGCFGNTYHLSNKEDTDKFILYVINFFKNVQNNEYNPTVVYDKVSKKPSAFYCFDIKQYEGSAGVNYFEGISEAIDNYYCDRDIAERMARRSQDTIKLINNNIERCEKKTAIHGENLLSAQNREQYKMFGDLLTANMYQLKYGMKSAQVQNFYSEAGEMAIIPLKDDISPAQNAQRYYTLYNKAKMSEKYAVQQLAEAEAERKYLETVLEAVQKAENSAELAEIREELTDEGYIKRVADKKKRKVKSIVQPMKFTSSDGFTVLAGKNNRQNDFLTLKMAFSSDIWLHTKTIAGSHTVIHTEGGREVPARTLEEAASIAAYYSKGRNSANVAVDYTEVKNVKKPSGAKPGMVIYENYKTIYVTPNEDMIRNIESR